MPGKGGAKAAPATSGEHMPPPPRKSSAATSPPAAHKASPDDAAPTCPLDDPPCNKRLAELLSDPARAWIDEAPGPFDYATGLRLAAFDALRDELTCKELQTGVMEGKSTIEKLVAAAQSQAVSSETKAGLQRVQDEALNIQERLAHLRASKCPDHQLR